jgi:hypothetical protein
LDRRIERAWSRLTPRNVKTYGAAFRLHTGRSDPLPDEGAPDEIIEMIANQFGANLTSNNH